MTAGVRDPRRTSAPVMKHGAIAMPWNRAATGRFPAGSPFSDRHAAARGAEARLCVATGPGPALLILARLSWADQGSIARRRKRNPAAMVTARIADSHGMTTGWTGRCHWQGAGCEPLIVPYRRHGHIRKGCLFSDECKQRGPAWTA